MVFVVIVSDVIYEQVVPGGLVVGGRPHWPSPVNASRKSGYGGRGRAFVVIECWVLALGCAAKVGLAEARATLFNPAGCSGVVQISP